MLLKVTMGIGRAVPRKVELELDLPIVWTSVTSLWPQLSRAITGIDEWKRNSRCVPWPDKLLGELAAHGIIEVQLRREPIGGKHEPVEADAPSWRAAHFLQDGQLYDHRPNAPAVGHGVEIRLAQRYRPADETKAAAGKQPPIGKRAKRATLVHFVWVKKERPDWTAPRALDETRADATVKKHPDYPLLIDISDRTEDRAWEDA